MPSFAVRQNWAVHRTPHLAGDTDRRPPKPRSRQRAKGRPVPTIASLCPIRCVLYNGALPHRFVISTGAQRSGETRIVPRHSLLRRLHLPSLFLRGLTPIAAFSTIPIGHPHRLDGSRRRPSASDTAPCHPPTPPSAPSPAAPRSNPLPPAGPAARRSAWSSPPPTPTRCLYSASHTCRARYGFCPSPAISSVSSAKSIPNRARVSILLG